VNRDTKSENRDPRLQPTGRGRAAEMTSWAPTWCGSDAPAGGTRCLGSPAAPLTPRGINIEASRCVVLPNSVRIFRQWAKWRARVCRRWVGRGRGRAALPLALGTGKRLHFRGWKVGGAAWAGGTALAPLWHRSEWGLDLSQCHIFGSKCRFRSGDWFGIG
jgi:hypothetical protein